MNPFGSLPGLLAGINWEDPNKMDPSKLPLGLLGMGGDRPAPAAQEAGPAPMPPQMAQQPPMQLPGATPPSPMGSVQQPMPQGQGGPQGEGPGFLDKLGAVAGGIYGQGGPGDGLINLGAALASRDGWGKGLQQMQALNQQQQAQRQKAQGLNQTAALISQKMGIPIEQAMGLVQSGGAGPALAQMFRPPAQQTYGVVGKDAFGKETYGWINPNTQTTTPAGGPPPATAGAPATGPGQPLTVDGPDGPITVPPGVDPAKFREEVTKRTAGAALGPTDEATGKLRGEVQGLPSYKNFAQAAPIYQNMLRTAGTNSKASDLNLVYSLGKIFDPGSVVREGEMVMVKNTASLPDWLVGTANSLNGGQALTPETRAAIMKEAHDRISSYGQQFQQDATFYKDIAGRQKMNAADIIPSFGDFPTWTPQPAGGAAPAQNANPGGVPVRVTSPEEARRLPKGTRIILPDGSEGRVP